MMKKWQKRYFVIDPKLKNISYYEVTVKRTLVKKGEYILTNKSLIRKVPSNSKPGGVWTHVLMVSGESRNNIMDKEMEELYIAVPNVYALDQWMDAVKKAIKGEEFSVTEEAEACCSACTIA